MQGLGVQGLGIGKGTLGSPVVIQDLGYPKYFKYYVQVG